MKELMIYDESDPIEIAVKEKLKEGQVFKTFSELCQQCEIPLNEGGKQRDLAKSVLSRYVDFSEFVPEGRKRTNYRINKIYDVPRIQPIRSGPYRSRLILMIYNYLSKRGETLSSNNIKTTYDKLAVIAGLIKPEFMELIPLRDGATDQLRLLPEFVKDINPRHISDFIASCRSRFNDHIRGTLNEMAKVGMIESFDENYWLIMSDGSPRWAEDWEREIISNLYNERITKGKPLHHMKRAERKAVLDDLYTEINSAREKYFKNRKEHEQVRDTIVLQYYKRLLIRYKVDEMRTAAERISISLPNLEQSIIVKRELSELFSDTMKNAFLNQYNGLMRSEQRLNEERKESLAFGYTSDQTPYAFIYDDYIAVMDKLIALVIDR